MKVSGNITADTWRTQGGWTLQRRGTSLAIGARSLPVNRTTERYAPLKGRLRQIVSRWRNNLTSSQRGGWNTWASASPWQRWTGRPAFLRGVNAYAAQNLPRLAAGLPVLDDSPNTSGPSDPGTILTSVRNDGLIQLEIDTAAPWVGRDDAALIVSVSQYASRRTTPPRHEMATVAALEGSSTTPPGQTQILANPFGSTRWTGSTATVGLHLTDPNEGPAPGSKGDNDVPPPPPPAPSTCPCWTPPCQGLATTYTLQATLRPHTNACAPEDLTTSNDFAPNNPCEWASPSTVPFQTFIGLDTTTTPPVWRAQVFAMSTIPVTATKATGSTPVGLYAPDPPNQCDATNNTSAWNNVRVF
jgi:hypothetical protein